MFLSRRGKRPAQSHTVRRALRPAVCDYLPPGIFGDGFVDVANHESLERLASARQPHDVAKVLPIRCKETADGIAVAFRDRPIIALAISEKRSIDGGPVAQGSCLVFCFSFVCLETCWSALRERQ